MTDIDGSTGGRCAAAGCDRYTFLLYRCDACDVAFCDAHAGDHAPCRGGSRQVDPPTSGPAPTCEVCGPVDATALVKCETCGATVCITHRFHNETHKRGDAAAQRTPETSAPDGDVPKRVLGESKGARLQLGPIGARGSAEGLHAPVHAALAVLDTHSATLSATRFVVLPPQWVVGRLLDTVCDLSATDAGKVALGGVSSDLRVTHTASSDEGKLGVVRAGVDAESKAPVFTPLDLSATLAAAIPREALLIIGAVPQLANLQPDVRDEVRKRLQRVDPLAFFSQKTGKAEERKPAEETGAPQPPPKSESVQPTVPVIDDSATPFPALVATPFGASKLKALAAKEAGASSVVVAVYILDLPTASPAAKQIAAAAKRGLRAACVRLNVNWSVGRALDVILSAFPQPPPLGSGDDRLRLVHLRQPAVVDNSTTVAAMFKNGDAVLVSPGGVVPASVLAEARQAVAQQAASALPQATKLKMQKDCVVA
uniref:AN1-type domain-containing protein n=1 Tax=Neobodo designis TaxID=312471 RepID=A0A7S1QXF2_NEODS|mmetsp:Transcript_53721/g.165290  ORF Transcript_53721/g.165290 Transcript_53721/m.165290 type:complete len:484 (+) Transcript_53721:28-1479(+)|eukprot:CAMPEP_0174844720 /NCGR_PEP_ID=MMETSP1114-20130205/11274_1 /TAXON_ID=312471 /ORGANISM="Neobodo designis, Strain CCAP 1951/1" /LENGTH=483 /DNA_ID=CAMNT_0016078963 /DNA_START=28 /DNA_END=1479 /DNA_ORIENTATION=+